MACADLLDYRQSLLEPGQTNCISGDVVGGQQQQAATFGTVTTVKCSMDMEEVIEK